MFSIWWLIDTAGSIVGLPLNFLLIYVIHRVSRDGTMYVGSGAENNPHFRPLIYTQNKCKNMCAR